MIVRYRTVFDDDEREFIAAYWDSYNQVWPRKKRLATHKECRAYIHHARCMMDVFDIDTIYEWDAMNETKDEDDTTA